MKYGGRSVVRREIVERYYRIQAEIASKAVLEDCIDIDRISLVAGADQAFFSVSASRDKRNERKGERKGENAKQDVCEGGERECSEVERGDEERIVSGEERIISAVVVLSYPSFEVLEHAFSVMRVNFPYVPGLLAFREAPAIIDAFNRLKRKPDVLFIDGCGINHPRFAGLATHVGVTLDIPTIGVAKNLLCGSGVIPENVGEYSEIVFKGRVVGYFLKSKRNCKPIIVAPGNKISVKTALELTKRCIRKHKLPEPTRIAHICANKIKRAISSAQTSHTEFQKSQTTVQSHF